jgi:hypothetical protein
MIGDSPPRLGLSDTCLHESSKQVGPMSEILSDFQE